jgi:hypothetical protein
MNNIASQEWKIFSCVDYFIFQDQRGLTQYNEIKKITRDHKGQIYPFYNINMFGLDIENLV